MREQLETLDAVNLDACRALKSISDQHGVYTGVETASDVLGARRARSSLSALGAALAVLVIGWHSRQHRIGALSRRASVSWVHHGSPSARRAFDIVLRLLVEGFLVAFAGAAGGLALGAWLLSAQRMR